MHIFLVNRPDRMGANLSWYIMQLIYAHYNNYYVFYEKLEFEDSFFIQMIQCYTEWYNQQLESKGIEKGSRVDWVEPSQQDWPGNCMIVCKHIQSDLVSYFKTHFGNHMRAVMEALSLKLDISSPAFNPEKTICVHLRLDDVIDRKDYDGRISSSYYAEKLNSGHIGIDLGEERIHGLMNGVDVPGWGRYYNPYDCQAPIDQDRLLPVIQTVQSKFPDHEVLVVASPIGKITLPYKTLRSSNQDMDLYALCNCNVLICSRSSFSFCAVYLGRAKEIWVPMWGHIAATGLTSKYDNSHLNYFY